VARNRRTERIIRVTLTITKSELKDLVIAEDGEVEAIIVAEFRVRPVNLLRLAHDQGKHYDRRKALAYEKSKKKKGKSPK